MNKKIMAALAFLLLLLILNASQTRADDVTAVLFEAIRAGNTENVANLLAAGASPDSRGNDGITALMLAAFEGNTPTIKLLVERGAGVDAKSDQGLTALMIAAAKGHEEVVKLLLDKGADPNALDASGLSAFHMAAAEHHKQIADLLLQRTKGAAKWHIKTVVGPMNGKEDCLPVMKSPDENSPKVACLKSGREVITKGTPKDDKWAMLEKPASGWVLMERLQEIVHIEEPKKPSVQRSSASRGVSERIGGDERSTGKETGSNDPASAPRSSGPEWWKRR